MGNKKEQKNHQKQENRQQKKNKSSKKQKKSFREHFDWNIHIKNFQSKLENKQLEIVEIIGDGNCLFRSIAHQIDDDENNHQHFRQLTVDYLKNNKDYFQPFIEDDIQFDDYLKQMTQDGEWGDNIEIQALSMALEMNIIIHQLDTQPLIIQFDDDKDTQVIQIAYHVLDENYQHYSSVQSKQKIEFQDNQQNKSKSKEQTEEISIKSKQQCKEQSKYPRNQKCFCGSKLAYKKCCMISDYAKPSSNINKREYIAI